MFTCTLNARARINYLFKQCQGVSGMSGGNPNWNRLVHNVANDLSDIIGGHNQINILNSTAAKSIYDFNIKCKDGLFALRFCLLLFLLGLIPRSRGFLLNFPHLLWVFGCNAVRRHAGSSVCFHKSEGDGFAFLDVGQLPLPVFRFAAG